MTYEGGRTSDAIVAWCKKKQGPVAKGISNIEELESFTKGGAVVFFAAKDSAGIAISICILWLE